MRRNDDEGNGGLEPLAAPAEGDGMNPDHAASRTAGRVWPAGAAVLWAAAVLAVLAPAALASAIGGFGQAGVAVCLGGVALVYGALALVALAAAVSADFEPERPAGPPSARPPSPVSNRNGRRARRIATPPPSASRRLRTSLRRPQRSLPMRRRLNPSGE